MRDDFSTKTAETLANRVGSLCSNPDCRRPTRGPQDNPAKAVNVGVAAHITAASPGGPRFDPALAPEERSGPENGIWLCQTHAKLIDNDPDRYTVGLLREWKREAEERIRRQIEGHGGAGSEEHRQPRPADAPASWFRQVAADHRRLADHFDRPAELQMPGQQLGRLDRAERMWVESTTLPTDDERAPSMLSSGQATIFISYAHADARWKDKLLVHLKAAFGLAPHVEIWDDRRIRVGDAWRQEIEEALACARAAVLMVSADFLASDFIQRAELPILLKRRQQEGVHLLPLLVSPCPWQYHHWLTELQMWPHDARSLKGHPHADTQLAHFAGLVEARLRPPPPPIPWAPLPAVSVPLRAPAALQNKTPGPSYRDQHARQKGEELARAYQQRAGLSDAGADTTAIDTRILGLKRDLRQGPQLQPGEFLGDGRYQLIRNLDHGGFATVWLAFDREESQQVAIKVLHGQFSTSEERRERLFRGARQMAKLDHPNVVKVLGEPAVEDGWAYYVMEFLEGGDFRRAVLDGRLSLDARLDALGKVAEVLDAAHKRGMIHRDVKPANILLTADGQSKLTDFDLVQADDSTGLTRTRAGMGSYYYAAPECQEDAANATGTCDVYSLAATLVFALSGKELGSRFLFQRSAFLSELDLPEAAREVLGQALDLEPAKRPASAGTFYRELQAALKARPEPIPEPRPSRSKTSELEKPTRRSTRVPVPGGADLFRTILTSHDGEVALWREIPAGEGVIGSRENEGHSSERPCHRILLTQPFWMSVVPITNAHYAAFNSKQADLSNPDHPVVKVTWYQANGFCAWLAKQHGFTGARLPTEEEWEYACRAGSRTAYWSGDKEADLARVGWYEKNSENRTHAVGEKPANEWGLYDVHGNVWEWTASIWDSEKYQKQSTEKPLRLDPTKRPADLAVRLGGRRVLRGGSYWLDASRARSAYRRYGEPDEWNVNTCFRVLLLSAPGDV